MVSISTLVYRASALFELQVGTWLNSLNSDNGLTYSGGGNDWRGRDDGTRGLPSAISEALDTYGSLNTIAIARQLGPLSAETLAQAETINRELGTAFNRNMDIRSTSIDPDFDASLTFG